MLISILSKIQVPNFLKMANPVVLAIGQEGLADRKRHERRNNMRTVRVIIGFELETDECVDNLNQDALEMYALLDDKDVRATTSHVEEL
jgi:hypothetical protein